MKKAQLVGGGIFLTFCIGFPWIFSNPTVTGIAVFTILFAVVVTGWNLFSGYTGYVSLGHGAFFGIGAYALTILCQRLNVPGGYLPFALLLD